jgi:DNA-binding NtrC family response regulator
MRRALFFCKTARSSLARPLPESSVMNSMTGPTPTAAPSTIGYHGAVSDFKRRLIEATLHQARGNRTHAARALGLQRTYLLRLIRDLGVAAPPPPPRRRRSAA